MEDDAADRSVKLVLCYLIVILCCFVNRTIPSDITHLLLAASGLALFFVAFIGENKN